MASGSVNVTVHMRLRLWFRIAYNAYMFCARIGFSQGVAWIHNRYFADAKAEDFVILYANGKRL